VFFLKGYAEVIAQLAALLSHLKHQSVCVWSRQQFPYRITEKCNRFLPHTAIVLDMLFGVAPT
jgi:hypothetical protein